MEHQKFDWNDKTWNLIETGRAEPDEYKARILECMAEVKSRGLRYNAETYPAVAQLMTERYGYPDARTTAAGKSGDADVEKGFGSHCYMASGTLDQRRKDQDNREAAATFHVGQVFKRLILGDLKQVTGATITEIDADGKACKMIGKRGKNQVSWTFTAAGLVAALERVESRDARRAGAPIPGSTMENGIRSVTIDLGAWPAPMSERLAALARAA